MLLPEWAPQDALLLAWPAPHTDWRDCLDEARDSYRKLIAATAAWQPVILLVPDDAEAEAVQRTLAPTEHTVHCITLPYDDTWVRDTGPLSLGDGSRSLRWLDFRFDGWGGKFEAARDDALVAELVRSPAFRHLSVERFDWVLEGGAIESDGRGTILTTTRCLSTREPGLDRAALETRLLAALQADRVLWLRNGELQGDDTDGHVDTIARFATPGTIVYQSCDDPDDPHHGPLDDLARELGELRTASGAPYRLVPLPLPEPRFEGDRRLPAGYANFLILNGAVLVPTYDAPEDAVACERLAGVFPDRRIVGVDCSVLIRQGGSLHCATMQLPTGTLRPASVGAARA